MVMNLKFPSIFDSIEFRKFLGEADAVFHGFSPKSERYTINSLGPFIFFSKNKSKMPSHIIFAFSYTVCQTRNQQSIVELQYNNNLELKCRFDFKTKEKALYFLDSFHDLLQRSGMFILNTNYTFFEQKTEVVECIFPGESKFIKSLATISNIARVLKFQLLRMDNSNLGFEAVLDSKSSVSVTPLMSNIKALGKGGHINCFTIKSKASPYYVIVKCESLQSLINWVILIFAYSNRASASTIKQNSSTSRKKQENNVDSRKTTQQSSKNSTEQNEQKREQKQDSTNHISRNNSSIQTTPKSEPTSQVSEHNTTTQVSETKNNHTDDIAIEDIQIENIPIEDDEDSQIKQETNEIPDINPIIFTNQSNKQPIEKKTAVLLQSNQTKHSNCVEHVNEIEPFEIPELKDFEQQFEEYKNIVYEKPPEPEIPSFEKLSYISKTSLDALFSKTKDITLSSIINDLHDDHENLRVFPFENKSFPEIIEETITNIEAEYKFDFENNFDFSINPEFNVKSFESSTEPDTQYFFNEISNLNTAFISSGNAHKDDNPYVNRLCFLFASLLVNGLNNFIDIKSNQSLVQIFKELSAFIPELSQLQKLIEKETFTINQASISSCFMIKNDLVDQFILQMQELERKTDFLMKYYNITALIRNSTFMETLSFMIQPIFENNTFTINYKSNIIQCQNDEDIKRYVLTPGFEYLEIDQIFQKDSNIVKIISNQFNNGLKPKGLLKLIDPWQMIVDISSIQYQNEMWKEFVEFIQSIKTSNLMKSSQTKLEILIEEGLKKKKIHIWMLYLIINENKINEYYYKESSLSDSLRIRYIIQKIAKYFDENKQN